MAEERGMNSLQVKFLDTLRQSYSDVEKVIMSTVPPKNNQTVQNTMLSIADIDNILINNMKAVLSVAVYDLRMNVINITAAVTSEYYHEFIPEMIPKITYGVASITSKYILSQMQLYMSKCFIFAYIKERIVRPHIKAEIDIILQEIHKDTALKSDMRQYKILQEDINNMIYELMIAYDRDKFVSIMRKYVNNKDISPTIVDILNDSKIFVPNFIFDVFSKPMNTDELQTKLNAFFSEYYISNTDEAITDLFKRYSNKTIGFVNVTKYTITERSDYHGLNNLSMIDGVSFMMVKIINKMLTLTELTEEELTLIKEDETAKSIKSIIDKYKTYGVTFKIDNTVVTIRDIANKETQVAYRKNSKVEEIDNPFAVFGMDAKSMEDTFTKNPDKSPLTQTGITKVEERNMFLSRKSIANTFATPALRITHRRRKIAELKARYAKDAGLMTEVDMLVNGTMKCKYMDTSKTSIYTMTDERKLLLTLAEMEGLYKKIENYKKEASK